MSILQSKQNLERGWRFFLEEKQKKKRNPYLPGVSLKHTSQFVLCINDRAQAESDSLILLQSGSDRSKCKVDQADENWKEKL